MAILAAFVFCPSRQGRSGSNIAQVAKSVFYSLFKHPSRYTKPNVSWVANVTIEARVLVRQGYLMEAGFRDGEWKGEPIKTRLFQITEVGLLYVLAHCDVQRLPDHRLVFDAYHKRKKADVDSVDRAFSRLIETHRQERYFGKEDL